MSHQPTVRAYGTLYTLRALEALARGPLTASALGARIGVDERTARRILRRLVAEGYASQGDWHHRRFAATTRLAGLGHQTIGASALVRQARPTLEALATHGPTALWIPAPDATVLRVDRTPAGTTLGARLPLADHAAGLALTGGVILAAHAGTLAAPILDQDRRIAAISLTPPPLLHHPRLTDLARIFGPTGTASHVLTAATTITAVLRDGLE